MTRLLLTLVCGTAIAVTNLAAQSTDSLPPGVTPAQIEEGQRLFGGAGICMACHGPNGRGMPNLGPDLGDAEWLHGDGSLSNIVQRILDGVSVDESRTGVVMPPRGGSRLTDEQVHAVAAYVWSLRRVR